MKTNRHQEAGTDRFRRDLPIVTEAVHRYWRDIGGIVPFDLLLTLGVRQLRLAIEREEPLVLDLATPIIAALQGDRQPSPGAKAA